MKIGVIIARFQTPYLHAGHINLIEQVIAKHKRTAIVLGVSPVKGKRNPYDYYTREKMLKAVFPDVVVLPLRDQAQDNVWSEQLDALIGDTFQGPDVVLYGSRDSFIPYYIGRYATEELAQEGDHNATALRAEFADQVLATQDFRTGVLYAVNNQYNKVYPTVDVAVFRNEKKELLLGKKPNESNWRLIGGFVDPEDACFEDAALREMQEEAGALEVNNMSYETSQRVDDWRYRKEADKIITTLFSCDYVFGTPSPQDDIEALNWFEVKELKTMIEEGKINPTHHGLITLLFEKYGLTD